MNTNSVRWNLHNYHTNKKIISQLKSDLEEYRKMDGMKAQVLTGMPGVHSNESKTESAAIDRIEYISRLEIELDKLMRINRAIESIYFYLKEPARSIVELRYFTVPKLEDVRQRKHNWEEIGGEVNYSEDYCKEIDGKVVTQIQAKIYELSHI